VVTIKTPQEIEIMRAGGKILAKILDEVAQAVKPGITTNELDELAQELIFANGAKPAFLGHDGFPAALCASVNEVVVHAIPSGDKLKNGDIIGLDLGIVYPFKDCSGCFMIPACNPPTATQLLAGSNAGRGNCSSVSTIPGLYTDMAITVPVGKVNKKALKIISVAQMALEIGLDEVKPGNFIGDIGFAIQKYVESEGFSVIRSLVGHGVGRQLHEPPEIPNYGKRGSGPELRPGMTLAIEPMISAGSHELVLSKDGHGYETKDKSLTAHFEHTLVVTESGYEILTLHT
jgi:methionyl aminopeptidase